jgi:hypothetical protein
VAGQKSKLLGGRNLRMVWGRVTLCRATLDLSSPYVASEMTNNNKIFQKIQNFPKKPKISKKAKFAKNA